MTGTYINFRKVCSGLDVGPLLAQLEATPTASPDEECFPYPTDVVKWRLRTEWTAKKDPRRVAVYNTYNIVLRWVTLGMDPARVLYLFENDRGRCEWTRPFASAFRNTALPIVRAVLDAAECEHIGKIIISRLPPGDKISEHVDMPPTGIPPGTPYWWRYQVPIQADEGVIYECDGEAINMEPGSAFWFDMLKKHAIYNRSSRDRINMIVELRPMFRDSDGVRPLFRTT